MPSDNDSVGGSLTLVGVPATKRVRAFADAARRQGWRRVELLPYLRALAADCPPPAAGSVVRIESPSECTATGRAILKAGAAALEAAGGAPLSAREIDGLGGARGEILPLKQWFYGFREILSRWEASWGRERVRWMSRPAAIATAFDKLECLERWSAASIPVARRFPGIATYDRLRAEIDERHARIFVKPRYGYSAVGAVALEWRGAAVRAITTVEAFWESGRPRLFVSKRPQVLTSEFEIARLIDALGADDLIVEAWLPKARWHGRPFDVRVVVIGGRARHVVGRANASPFTNLNLDARRMPSETIADRLGASWNSLKLLAEEAADHLPGAGVLGMDVLVRPDRCSFAVLEANAFGDYLPGLLDEGETTYEAQLRRAGCPAGAPE
jgi:glutathione synthase/RimK-type ligase-like ATP-grasp enzyme